MQRIAAARIAVMLVAVFLLSGAAETLAQQAVTIVLPGNQLPVDSTVLIRWYNFQILDSMRLEYTTDSVSWKLLAVVPPLPTAGSYLWTVPDDTTSRGYLRIVSRDTVRGRSMRFTITRNPRPVLSFYAPTSQESWFFDSKVMVRWYAQFNTQNIIVEYTIDSGATWRFIANAGVSQGIDSVLWTIPRERVTNGHLRVRSEDTSLVTQSPSGFSVRPPRKVSLMYPTGGEALEIDSMIYIKWSSTSIDGQLAIDYSIDSGAYWFPITTRDAHDGIDSITWFVPSSVTHAGLVRVYSETSLAGDTTDAPFNIVVTLTGATVNQSSSIVTEHRAVPNPTTNQVTLHFTLTRPTRASIRIHATDGRTVYYESKKDLQQGSNVMILDTSALPAGTYIYEIGGATDSITGPLTIVR